MKINEKQKARKLREQGVSMGEIATRLGVAKSSVSYWVRDIELTTSQLNRLNKNGHSVAAIEKRRQARLANTKQKRLQMIKNAQAEVSILQNNPLWCIGVSLYWGEGGKTQQSVRLANSDPAVIKIIMRFFREICELPENKFHGHVHTFAHANARHAEKYWSNVSGIPVKNFYKTYIKQSSASKNKRDTLPYGTFQVYAHDTKCFYRIMGWIEGIKEKHGV